VAPGVLEETAMPLRFALSLAALLGCAGDPAVPVGATAETTPVASGDDAADDPCIWVDAERPERSTVIGTDKRDGGGLYVYDLAGEPISFLPIGEINNVDLRQEVALGGETVALVAAGDRTNHDLVVFRVDPETRDLVDVAAEPLGAGILVYGSCLYQNPTSGQTYAFVTAKSGQVVQHVLIDDGTGRIVIERVRDLDVGGQLEGCVADDEHGYVYIGEEEVGIWRYGAEPGDGDARQLIAATGDGSLVPEVEGLAIYRGPGGGGYLIASSQGNSTFAVYERGADNAHLFSFSIVGAGDVDGVSDTDGIEVTNAGLGSMWPDGLFVAQDGDNGGENTNYKLVSWGDIAAAADPPLSVDTALHRRPREEP
jgi:3-phytase